MSCINPSATKVCREHLEIVIHDENDACNYCKVEKSRERWMVMHDTVENERDAALDRAEKAERDLALALDALAAATRRIQESQPVQVGG